MKTEHEIEYLISKWREQCFDDYEAHEELWTAASLVEELLAERKVARERFGPAGYKIIAEVAELRKKVKDLENRPVGPGDHL